MRRPLIDGLQRGEIGRRWKFECLSARERPSREASRFRDCSRLAVCFLSSTCNPPSLGPDKIKHWLVYCLTRCPRSAEFFQRSCVSGRRGITSTCCTIEQTSRRPPSAACWRGSWTESPARTSRSCRWHCRALPRRWRGRVIDETLYPRMTQVESRWRTVLSAYICVICG
jgi:hypothetical protein